MRGFGFLLQLGQLFLTRFGLGLQSSQLFLTRRFGFRLQARDLGEFQSVYGRLPK